MAEEGGYACRVSTGHPCEALIEQLLKALACCLGLCDSLCYPRATSHSQDQGTNGTATASSTEDDPPRITAARRRPRQPTPSEGRGGQIN